MRIGNVYAVLPLIVISMIANILFMSAMAQEPINTNSLLEQYPLDKCHIDISKKLEDPNKIVYQITVEGYTKPTELNYNTQLHPADIYYKPYDVSVYYSVNDSVYICYDEIKTEFCPTSTVKDDPPSRDYLTYEPDENAICKGTVAKGAVDSVIGVIPIVGSFYGLRQYSGEILRCLPKYSQWYECTIQYDSIDQTTTYVDSDVPISDIITSIDGKTEKERNSRRSNTIRFAAVAVLGTSGQDQIDAVRFTIPVKLKNSNDSADFRLWLDSVDALDVKIGAYLEDTNIGKFKPPLEPTMSGQITDVTWPTKDTYDRSEPVPVKVDFTNTGSEAHSFWVGYSVQDSAGKWWDAPAQPTAVTQPGESGSLELQWLPPEEAPEGAYAATVALWENYNSDSGLMEGEFDRRTKDIAFQLNPSEAYRNVILKTDFEDYEEDTTPTDFSIKYNGKGDDYQMITTDESHSGSKSLQLWGKSHWSSNVYYYLDKPETGRIGFEVMVKANPQEEGWVQFISPDEEWGWGGILFDSDNYIKAPATSPNPYKVIQSEHRWYKVRSEIDVETGACWVWIDDELVVDGVTPADAGRGNPEAFEGIRCVAFGDNSWYEDPSTPTYFDDLTIYTVPTDD